VGEQDDGAHVVVAVEFLQRVGQLGDRRLVERIVDVGSRECHQRDRVADLGHERRVRPGDRSCA
jgi:hypothetical protein